MKKWSTASLMCAPFLMVTVGCDIGLEDDDYVPCPDEFNSDGEYWCEGNVIMECYETSVDWNNHNEVHVHEDCDNYDGSECVDGKCVLSGVDCTIGEQFCMDNMVMSCIGNSAASIDWDCNKSQTTCVEAEDSGPSVQASCE